MMRRRVGIWGASDESLRLLRLLLANPGVEVSRIYDEDVAAALERARSLGLATRFRDYSAQPIDPLFSPDPLSLPRTL